MKLNKRTALILTSVVVLISILSAALLLTNSSPQSDDEEESLIPEAEAENSFPYDNRPFNFTIPEDFNGTFPVDGFNSTFPVDGFNGTFPDDRFNSTFPDDMLQDDGSFLSMSNLTDEQRTIVEETMQELTDSGATQEEITAAIRELMEDWEIQAP
ncbi:MAG: hypothetical protein NWF06_06775 [Candidatus Bathyarchaeota archaeon]|nr:hypothetical protein [Candidatus Bathyarchaeum sp.]